MPQLRRVPGFSTGTVTWAENPFEIAAANTPGVKDIYSVSAASAQLQGTRRRLISRWNPALSFLSPTAAKSPALLTADVNGRDALEFVQATTHEMNPAVGGSAMTLNGSSGWLLLVVAFTGTASNHYVLGNSTNAAASTDYVPNIMYSVSGATEFTRIAAGNQSIRQVETTATDLNNAYHSALWTWDTTNGFSLFLNGVSRTLSSVDTNGFTTSGVFDIGRRSTIFGSFKLAGFAHGTVNLGLVSFATQRAALLDAARTTWALP